MMDIEDKIPLDFSHENVDRPCDPMGWVALFNIISQKAKETDNNGSFHPRYHTHGIVKGLRTLFDTWWLVVKSEGSPEDTDVNALASHRSGEVVTSTHLDELEALIGASDILSHETIALIRRVVTEKLTYLHGGTKSPFRSLLII